MSQQQTPPGELLRQRRDALIQQAQALKSQRDGILKEVRTLDTMLQQHFPDFAEKRKPTFPKGLDSS